METSDVLIDALQYIKQFRGQVFIIKIGGEILLDDAVLDAIAQDVILLNHVNIKPVIIHGGGPEITSAMQRFGKAPTFIEGLRVTDEETMDIVKMVLIGKINTGIVARINKFGGSAVGISGKSGRLFSAEKKESKIDLGRVGDIVSVNSDIVRVLLEKDYIPVISPLGFDTEGNSLNINADTAAAKLAVSLGATKLLLMTSAGGVKDSSGELIHRLTPKGSKDLIQKQIATDGMIPKLEACIHAVSNGINGAHIIGSKKHSILEEIFTSKGIGTMVMKNDG